MTRHFQQSGHTFYVVEGSANGVDWRAEKRLSQLRALHDKVVTTMGRPAYSSVFGKTPFAGRLGMAGTTKRLDGWMRTLMLELEHPASITIDTGLRAYVSIFFGFDDVASQRHSSSTGWRSPLPASAPDKSGEPPNGRGCAKIVTRDLSTDMSIFSLAVTAVAMGALHAGPLAKRSQSKLWEPQFAVLNTEALAWRHAARADWPDATDWHSLPLRASTSIAVQDGCLVLQVAPEDGGTMLYFGAESEPEMWAWYHEIERLISALQSEVTLARLVVREQRGIIISELPHAGSRNVRIHECMNVAGRSTSSLASSSTSSTCLYTCLYTYLCTLCLYTCMCTCLYT